MALPARVRVTYREITGVVPGDAGLRQVGERRRCEGEKSGGEYGAAVHGGSNPLKTATTPEQ
jgi:hypothetical protein